MKRITVVLGMLCFSYVGNAQRISADKVPAAVKKTFNEKATKATNVKWEIEHGNYEANFKSGKTEKSMLFDKNGTMLESEVAISKNELPASAISYVQSHYKSHIKDAAKITKANGDVNFEAEVNKMDVLFTADGKFIKESKD